jgi:hypothetical protein
VLLQCNKGVVGARIGDPPFGVAQKLRISNPRSTHSARPCNRTARCLAIDPQSNALKIGSQLESKIMSITYPQPQKANPSVKPELAPTPILRAEAAVGEAISHIKGIARAGGMIGIFAGMSWFSAIEAEGDWMLWLILANFIVSLSLTLSATYYLPASKRPKFRSGMSENDIKFSPLSWLRWGAFIGASAAGIISLVWSKQIGLSRTDGVVLFALLMIMGQLISILMDTLHGVKLLRFAQAQLGLEEVG